MREVKNQRNNWAKQGGIEPQRSDLWVVDMSEASKAINNVVYSQSGATPAPLESVVDSQYAQSVSLPSLDVKSENVVRGSIPYAVPGADEPLGPTRIVFRFDSRTEARGSRVYRFLDAWRAVVRAGRGARGGEYAITLDSTYRANYVHNINVKLLRGSVDALINPAEAATRALGTQVAVKKVFRPDVRDDELFPGSTPESMKQLLYGNASRFSTTSRAESAKPISQALPESNLVVANAFVLERAWLSGFKLSELSYEGSAGIVTIEATFQIGNLKDESSNLRSAESPLWDNGFEYGTETWSR